MFSLSKYWMRESKPCLTISSGGCGRPNFLHSSQSTTDEALNPFASRFNFCRQVIPAAAAALYMQTASLAVRPFKNKFTEVSDVRYPNDSVT